MQRRTYQSNSLAEGNRILSREWSRHQVNVQHGQALRLRFSIRSITPAMSISSLSYGTQAVVLPEDRADVLLVQMPRSGCGLARFEDNSIPMDPANYAFIDARTVAQVFYAREVDMLVLRIAMERVNARLEEALGYSPAEPLSFARGMAQGSRAWAAWQPVAAALGALEASELTDFPGAAMSALEEMVISTLLLSQPHNHSEVLLRPQRAIAPRHVLRAEEFIHSNLHLAPVTADIAAHAGISIRALFDGFRRFRQTTPVAYVREARLAAARADLQRSKSSVREVAERWGFTHPGHFVERYRRRYGETPKQTMNAKAHGHRSINPGYFSMNPITHISSPGHHKTPPLSGATRFGGLLFVSGTPGYYTDGTIDDGDFGAQFDRAIAVMTQLLEAGGSSLRGILKVNVLLTRLEDVAGMNERYTKAFGSGPYPARTTSVVLSLPDPRMLLEVECVAAVGVEQ